MILAHNARDHLVPIFIPKVSPHIIVAIIYIKPHGLNRDGTTMLIERLTKTKNNEEFLESLMVHLLVEPMDLEIISK